MNTTTVKLRDLVTEESQGELAQEKLNCELTAAPQTGTTRIISQSELRRLLLSRGLDAAAFVLPQSVKVSRWSRLLTNRELRQAVDAFLIEHPITGVELDGRLESSDKVDIEQPELQVTDFEADRLQQIARFRFRVVNSTTTNEFWISVPARVSASITMPTRLGSQGTTPMQKTAKSKPRPAVLVHVMKTASLTVSGKGFQFETQVFPLQNGAAGDVIPVREEQTGKIFHAAVIGPQQLEIGQQVANTQ